MEKRNKNRHDGYAKVLIGSRPGYIRDISESGCRISSFQSISLDVNTEMEMELLEMKELGLDRAFFTIIVKWQQGTELNFRYGIQITGFRDDNSRTAYRKLLALYSEDPGQTSGGTA